MFGFFGGETIRHKVVLGTVKELNKTQAQKKVEDHRQFLNEPKLEAVN